MREKVFLLSWLSWVSACNPTPAATPPQAKAARPESPEFAVVDKFQLWATCAAVGVPSLSDSTAFHFARLRLADGSIKPWLIVEDTFFPEQQGPQAVERWQKQIDDVRRARNNCNNCTGPSVNPQAISYTYRAYPCDYQALQFTVVTAVFRRVSGKTRSADIVVMFGDRIERASTADSPEANRRALELAAKIVGQAAKPDMHRLPGDTADLATAPQAWIAAAGSLP